MFDLAIYYRMVGGFVGLGSTTLTRIRWALTIAVYMTFVSICHAESPLRWLLVFCGVFVGGFVGRLIPHSAFQSVASIKNSIGMTVVEAIRLALIVVPYAFTDWTGFGYTLERLLVIVLAVGAGVAYYVGNKYLAGKDYGVYYRSQHSQFIIADVPNVAAALAQPVPAGSTLDQCAVGGTEWGELLTGFFCYQAMYMALLVLK